MKTNAYVKRIISFFLVTALVITGSGLMTSAAQIKADADKESVVVIACSDFQHPKGNEAGKEVVKELFDSIASEGYKEAQGFLCCGDYDYEYTDTEQGVTALREVVEEQYGDDIDITMVQGNHDQVPIGTAGMSPSGNNDTDNYGVFVINEDDYMWYNDNEARIRQTSQNLKRYLYGKRKAKYTKPIFVVSHLALNYSMRTRNDGDGQYAHYIFDELNDAGKNGLNIIFLFGHNHSHGWDDYLGGSSIYQAKGEEILISDGTRENYTRETLEFTYMNAGYIGYYYGNENERNEGADDTLTMSVFEIRDDKVIVSRVDKDGLHELKSGGVQNESENHREKELGGYSPYTNTVDSPAEIILNKQIIKPEEKQPSENDPGESEKGKVYEKIKSLSDVKDGDKILMVYNGSFMLPKIKTADAGSGTRIGFELESADSITGAKVTGTYDDKEWTFTGNGSGWKIGSGGKYAKLTSTDDKGITATLETTGDTFTISGGEDSFTFVAGSYYLNWNESRGLINGYNDKPAEFSLYRYTGQTGNITDTDEYGDCDHPRKQIIDAKEPSCIEKGYSGDTVCTNCGEVLAAGEEIAASGHDWDAGVITTSASVASDGVKTYTCKRCGEKKTENIPKIVDASITSNPSGAVTSGSSGKDAGTAGQTASGEKEKGDKAYATTLKTPTITSIKKTAKKTVVVKWKKSAGAKGYQLWYSASKNFKGKKDIKIKSGKTCKVKIKKMNKKTYYFKIRAFVKVNGKDVYSSWSKGKKVKM